MSPIASAISALRQRWPYMSQKRAEETVRIVLEAVANDQPRTDGIGPAELARRVRAIGKIGKGGEASFPDPEG